MTVRCLACDTTMSDEAWFLMVLQRWGGVPYCGECYSQYVALGVLF